MAVSRAKGLGLIPGIRLRATPKPKRVVDVVPAGKTPEKLWNEAIARFRAAFEGESTSWDARYEALDEILNADPPYYLAGGYATARAFLKAEVPNESERTVRQGIRVARHFDPEDERRYGITILDALLGYLEAEAGGPLGRAKINLDRQTIPVKDGSGTTMIPFAEATRQQIQAAARAARGESARASSNVPPLVASLKKAMAAAGLSAIGVSMRGGKVTLSGIAPSWFGALAKVLKGVRGAAVG